jgi:hypothetical protein
MVMVAVAGLPRPASLEVTAVVVLVFSPVDPDDRTLTRTVHELLAGNVTPDTLNAPDPATACTIPPQVFDSPFGDATFNPNGNGSVNTTPLSAVPAFGFDNVNVNDVDAPFAIDA